MSCLILLRPHGLSPTRLLCPWDFPDRNTGVGCHFLLQGISCLDRWDPTATHTQVGSHAGFPDGLAMFPVFFFLAPGWRLHPVLRPPPCVLASASLPLPVCVHRILQTRILEWVATPSSRGSRDFSNPGIKAGSPALQVDYLPVELPGKPPNDNQFSSVQFSRSVMPDSL